MGLNLRDREYNYLQEQLKKANGIGNATAGKIISKADNFFDFNSFDRENLQNIKSTTGSRVLNDRQIEEILKILNDINFNEDIMILEVEEIISEFITKTYQKIKELDLDILDINPFLIRALKFDEAEEVILFYLYQRITRSIVTSWGMTVEKIAKSCGAEYISAEENVNYKGKKFDIKKKVDGKNYFIQVKSGPNTMNVGMVESLNQMIDKIESKSKDNIGILGMTFGNKEALSSQISGNLRNVEEKSKIGKEFWDFIAQKNGFTEELLNMISNAVKKYEVKERGKKLSDLINNKKNLLLEQWIEKYGGSDKSSIEKVERINL